jgi:hypothetical protein
MRKIVVDMDVLINICADMYRQGMSDFEEGIFIDSKVTAERVLDEKLYEEPPMKETYMKSNSVYRDFNPI